MNDAIKNKILELSWIPLSYRQDVIRHLKDAIPEEGSYVGREYQYLIYVPGHFRCTVCDFQLSKQTLSAKTGNIGITEDNLVTEACPNDSTLMVKVTWKEAAENASERLTEALNNLDGVAAGAYRACQKHLEGIADRLEASVPPDILGALNCRQLSKALSILTPADALTTRCSPSECRDEMLWRDAIATAEAVARLDEHVNGCNHCMLAPPERYCHRGQRLYNAVRARDGEKFKSEEPVELRPLSINSLTFNALRLANLSRNKRWMPNGLSAWSLSDWGVAAAGEIGEALNIIKKLNRARAGIVGNNVEEKELRALLKKELADAVIYLDILAASESINLEESIVAKFNETSEKNGFPERLSLSGMNNIRALSPEELEALRAEWEEQYKYPHQPTTSRADWTYLAGALLAVSGSLIADKWSLYTGLAVAGTGAAVSLLHCFFGRKEKY